MLGKFVISVDGQSVWEGHMSKTNALPAGVPSCFLSLFDVCRMLSRELSSQFSGEPRKACRLPLIDTVFEVGLLFLGLGSFSQMCFLKM